MPADLGELAPVRSLFERARDLRRSMLGDDHPHTLRSARNLAAALASPDGHDQARRLED
ncbi:MAG: tetratricopeptide repeat protein [Pseudonocardiales bacterium]|nr:tetratricopeptide repeat protein [Pseudonocardiales bacterium]MBV9031814.1 tetratricopeptide repeat protein [Pseudonocardiales bacterium]